MAKVDGGIRTLVQGVSQQPPRDRLPGQCTLQVNMSSDIVNGATKRTGLEYVGKLLDSADPAPVFSDARISGVDIVYAVNVGSINVWTLDAAAQTVNVETGADAYLTAADMSKITIDESDETSALYLSNPSRTVGMLNDIPTTTTENQGLAQVLGGAYGRTYRITVRLADGTEYVGSHSTPDGSAASHAPQISSNNIASQLKSALESAGGFSTNFEIEIKDETLWIKWKDGVTQQSIELDVDDGDGSTKLVASTLQTTLKTTNLPRYAPHGFTTKVTAASASEDDTYFMYSIEGETDGTGFGTVGFWLETSATGQKFKIDPATMPHKLVYDGDNTRYNFSQVEWANRTAGDDESNAPPDFVGRTIEDLSAFQGRLTILSGPTVSMSRTRKPREWFKQSATALNADDPIGMESTAEQSPVMRKAIPFNRDLVVFSDSSQYLILGRDAITPGNAALVRTTSFVADLTARPVPSGRNIFYSIDRGPFSGVREFYAEGAADVNDSRDVNDHVPRYITGTLNLFASADNFNVLLGRSQDDANQLYLYEYFWQNNQKRQSSWSQEEYAHPVEHMFFINDTLYVIQRRPDGWHLLKRPIDSVNDTGLDFHVHLDDKRVHTGVDRTLSIGDAGYSENTHIVVQGAGCPNPGLPAFVESVGSTQIVLRDSMNSGTVFVGRRYKARYRPTMPIVKDEQGQEIEAAQFRVKDMNFIFIDSGPMDALIESPYYDDTIIEQSNRILNDVNNQIGRPVIIDGVFTVPVIDDPAQVEVEVSSDSYLPLTLTEIEWNGSYRKRGRRITQ